MVLPMIREQTIRAKYEELKNADWESAWEIAVRETLKWVLNE